MRSSKCSMESRMHRSRNATMTCLWPAQCLVGGKGKRYAERHQEGRIHFLHHGTPSHSQHQRILGRGFRARRGIMNEWLRRNLNGCRFARECAVPCKRGAAQVERLFPFWHKADIPQRPARVRSSCQGGHRNRNSVRKKPHRAGPRHAINRRRVACLAGEELAGDHWAWLNGDGRRRGLSRT